MEQRILNTKGSFFRDRNGRASDYGQLQVLSELNNHQSAQFLAKKVRFHKGEVGEKVLQGVSENVTHILGVRRFDRAIGTLAEPA
jgi:hypothetical protein